MRIARVLSAVVAPLTVVLVATAATAAAPQPAPPSVIGISFQYGWDPGPGDNYPTHQGKGNVELDLEIGGGTYDSTTISSLTLKVDGAVGATHTCTPPYDVPSSCSMLYTFNPNAFTVGVHTLQPVMSTTGGTVTGALLHIVVNPNPGESTITSPADGATVSGVTDVTATGWTEPSDLDPVGKIVYSVDGVPLPGGEVPCPGAGVAYTCATTFHWDTTGTVDGPHILTAQLISAGNDFLWTDELNIYVLNAAPVAAVLMLNPGGTVSFGNNATVTGKVVDAHTHLPLGGVPVAVAYDVYGWGSETSPVRTAADGTFSDTIRLVANTTVKVTTGLGFPTAAQSTSVGVTVPITCAVPSTVGHGVAMTITCHADFLAYHSVLALRVSGGSVPHATLFGKIDSHGNVTFAEKFNHAGQSLSIKATTATTHTFTASTSPLYSLHVG